MLTFDVAVICASQRPLYPSVRSVAVAIFAAIFPLCLWFTSKILSCTHPMLLTFRVFYLLLQRRIFTQKRKTSLCDSCIPCRYSYAWHKIRLCLQYIHLSGISKPIPKMNQQIQLFIKQMHKSVCCVLYEFHRYVVGFCVEFSFQLLWYKRKSDKIDTDEQQTIYETQSSGHI